MTALDARPAPDITTTTVEVLDGGPLTTVQDVPGRIGLWSVGVPPSGPMDDLAHRLANRLVGNAEGAAALELTTAGPTLRFDRPTVIALGGAAMRMALDGQRVAPWTAVSVPAGSIVRIGGIDGPGMRATVAVRGGLATEPYLGSRSTFTLGSFGGHEGRALTAGDQLIVGEAVTGPPGVLPPGLAPMLTPDWEVGVLIGPHTAPDFLTQQGLDDLWRAEWTVHFNSARTGVRLVGPRPGWARPDGGEAGLHPSNIHDTGYAIGAVDLTGDMPIILGPDGPSLGGFVCPAVVAAAERWKLGQLAPGDCVRLVPWTSAQAAVADRRRRVWLDRATAPSEPLARPSWNLPITRTATCDDGVLGRREPGDDHPGVTYRRAGDRFLLVEYGPMTLDLSLRVRVHVLEQWATRHLGVAVDITAGVRSLLVQVDGECLTVEAAHRLLAEAEADLGDVEHAPLASRVVHLPLSWDDPATREATTRYIHGVRADVPWCPWNIEFIRRINGLADVADVHRIVHDASYLVLGLGDVYLGAPVATPLDPRHRLVTTKYNPARTWTPENAVGIGGAYLCIYGMEGPGGYQFVGRTIQVWNRDRRGPHFEEPWLLRAFDQLRFHPVSVAELLEQRAEQAAGRLPITVESATFRLADHRRFLADHGDEIDAFRTTQQAAFAAERGGVGVERRVVTASAVGAVSSAFAAVDADPRPGIWITLADRDDVLRRAEDIDRLRAEGADLPLAGTTLAVKDNIDVAGLPTTAGCPAYTYRPDADAPAVAALTSAGAVVIGKTNLDQFATGLVGVRSPYGICPNARWPDLIAGGSSSGSAVAVATGMVDLALGTDTAGSGRVPAAANGIVGLKPTRGRISARGVVPACRSLDCVSVFAGDVGLAASAASIGTGFDAGDPWSRPVPDRVGRCGAARIGVPASDSLTFDGCPDGRDTFAAAAAAVLAAAGSDGAVELDLGPFLAAGALLYGGSFVAERYEAVGAFVDEHPDAVDPVVGPIIHAAGRLPAWQLFRDRTELTRLATVTAPTWDSIDVLVVPTVPRIPTVAEVLAEPVAVNTMLGTYTNFVNLLDLCAVTVPIGPTTAAHPPASVTLIGPAWTEDVLVNLALRLGTPASPRSA